jgi:hypothetical protein
MRVIDCANQLAKYDLIGSLAPMLPFSHSPIPRFPDFPLLRFSNKLANAVEFAQVFDANGNVTHDH